MAEWWDQATDWLGDTFKPGGHTGAMMDAGYLDWSDLLGAAGRGLLDYGAQERARSAWRPINAPEPIVDPGRSFDLYDSSIANSINQRVAMNQLQSAANMKKWLVNAATGGPPASPMAPVASPPAVASNVDVSALPFDYRQPVQVHSGGGGVPPVLSQDLVMPDGKPFSVAGDFLLPPNDPSAPPVATPAAQIQDQVPQIPGVAKPMVLPEWAKKTMLMHLSNNDMQGALAVYTDVMTDLSKPRQPFSVVQTSPGVYELFNKETGVTSPIPGTESRSNQWRGTRPLPQARNDLFAIRPKILAGPFSQTNPNGYTPEDEIAYKVAWQNYSRDHYETVTEADGSTRVVHYEGDNPWDAGFPAPPRWTEAQTKGTDGEELPVSAPKPPNEGAIKSFGFYGRMRGAIERTEVIEDTPGFGMPLATVMALNNESGLADIWAYMAKQGMNEDMQEYFVHLHNFTTALLRKESGAAISDAEIGLAVQTYFPLPGEGKQAIAAKRSARRLVTDAMYKAALSARIYYEHGKKAGLNVDMPAMPDINGGQGSTPNVVTTTVDVNGVPLEVIEQRPGSSSGETDVDKLIDDLANR